MSVVEEVLLEEYERSLRISRALEQELGSLPRGSIRERIIDGHSYFYLQYRDGRSVRSDYVPRDMVEALRADVDRRKEVTAALREQKRTQKQIVRALGMEFINEHARA